MRTSCLPHCQKGWHTERLVPVCPPQPLQRLQLCIARQDSSLHALQWHSALHAGSVATPKKYVPCWRIPGVYEGSRMSQVCMKSCCSALGGNFSTVVKTLLSHVLRHQKGLKPLFGCYNGRNLTDRIRNVVSIHLHFLKLTHISSFERFDSSVKPLLYDLTNVLPHFLSILRFLPYSAAFPSGQVSLLAELTDFVGLQA